MPVVFDQPDDSRLLFTAPWEPIVVRRGDALGLRALADRFADAVAPDLNNRISDGRWVTILAWCLVRSQEAFHSSGGRGVDTRTQQTERYVWLRPLELIWVARTIGLATDDWGKRSLPGRRRVRRWYEEENRKTLRFGMTVDQFRAYRQTGVYGGYRLAFRKWSGMTVHGDGWTPGLATKALANWLNGKLAKNSPAASQSDDDAEDMRFARSAKLGRKDPCKWWLQQWPTFDSGHKGYDKTLPRPRMEFEVLPEADLLRPIVFGEGNGTRRLEIAREIGKSRAQSHIEICEHLASAFPSDPIISLLPRFSRLADAGMAAMDLIADALRGKNSVTLTEIVSRPEANAVCKELIESAQAWQNVAEYQIRHIETAHRFAKEIASAQPSACLRTLLHHHELYGGGLRWFVLRNGSVEPRTPPQQSGSSSYGFRLWSLCRLAIQCGVLKTMPHALLTYEESEDDQSMETSDG